MRARLCKRLNNVEMEYTYIIPRFIIASKDGILNQILELYPNMDYVLSFMTQLVYLMFAEAITVCIFRNKDTLMLLNKGYPIMALRRISRNATFKSITVGVSNRCLLVHSIMLFQIDGEYGIFHWTLFQIISECNIFELKMKILVRQ